MTIEFGQGDATYKALGQQEGVTQLVDYFYEIMAADSEYQTILELHPRNIKISRDKLARFLCGWTGGPNRYLPKYGSINIPSAHAHLAVTATERDQWLRCMGLALEKCGYPMDLQEYMIQQLSIPAERIRLICDRAAK